MCKYIYCIYIYIYRYICEYVLRSDLLDETPVCTVRAASSDNSAPSDPKTVGLSQ